MLALAEAPVERAETQAHARGLRTHPELLGDLEALPEVPLGLLGVEWILGRKDFAEKTERARLSASFASRPGQPEATVGLGSCVVDPTRQQERFADAENPWPMRITAWRKGPSSSSPLA